MRALFRHVLPENLRRAAPLSAWVSPRQEGAETPGEQQSGQPYLPRQWSNRRWPFLLVTALVSATVLLVEVTLTRVFSLFLHYHYVFIVLAIALLGLGLGATFWATAGRRWLQHSLRSPTGPLWQMFLAPLGLLMGLPFPVTLRLLSPLAETIVPWVWGVNAVACVLGSVAAVRLAVSWGLQEVVILGALVYVLAGCWGHRLLAQQLQRTGIPL